jgi:hypothetical protein
MVLLKTLVSQELLGPSPLYLTSCWKIGSDGKIAKMNVQNLHRRDFSQANVFWSMQRLGRESSA